MQTLFFSAPYMSNGLAGAIFSVSSSDSYPSTSLTVNRDFGIRARLPVLVKRCWLIEFPLRPDRLDGPTRLFKCAIGISSSWRCFASGGRSRGRGLGITEDTASEPFLWWSEGKRTKNWYFEEEKRETPWCWQGHFKGIQHNIALWF